MSKAIIILIAFVWIQCYFPPGTNDEVPPLAPSILSATIETNTQGIQFVRLTWKDNSDNETGFKIARRPGTGVYSDIKMVPTNTTSFDDYPPITTYGTTYSYKVRSVTNFYSSEYTDEVILTFM